MTEKNSNVNVPFRKLVRPNGRLLTSVNGRSLSRPRIGGPKPTEQRTTRNRRLETMIETISV